jgi:prepilin signal peptidase PulO-like enzyme (type II secretory pathway)
MNSPPRPYLLYAFMAAGLGMLLITPWLSNRFESHGRLLIDDETPLSVWLIKWTLEGITGLWFFAMGASLGSFLNVVVHRMPVGISLVKEASRCPFCFTQIRLRHNIPVLGWFRLKGRCAACDVRIPPRYPTVEAWFGLVGLGLMLCVFVTGGSNLPGRSAAIYGGILWTIWYLKGDLAGYAAFHAHLLFWLTVWALTRFDRQRLPTLAAGFAIALPLALSPCFPWLLPLGLAGSNGPDESMSSVVGLTRALAGLGFGIVAGALAGLFSVRSKSAEPVSGSADPAEAGGAPKPAVSLIPARWSVAIMAGLVGAHLGWQGTASVLLLAGLVAGLATLIQWGLHGADGSNPPPHNDAEPMAFGWRRGLSAARLAPMALLIATAAQLPLWRWLSERAWWPGHVAPLWWTAAAGLIGTLLLAWTTGRRGADAGGTSPGT